MGWASGDGANENSVPNEAEKVANERYPFEDTPPDVDLSEFATELRHVSSGLVNDLGHDGAWFLVTDAT